MIRNLLVKTVRRYSSCSSGMAVTVDSITQKLKSELDAKYVKKRLKTESGKQKSKRKRAGDGRKSFVTLFVEERPATVIVVVVLMALFVRIAIGSHPHSGQTRPPMFGDFEAHRHWMEVTVNLPVRDWYRDSIANQLDYWGLDYPPLQAYHSWLCGHLANLTYPEAIVLGWSNGFERQSFKHFMRLTVLVSDLLLFIWPAVRLFSGIVPFLGLALLYPSLVLIDHGHFQYNCCSLGLMLAAALQLRTGRLLRSAFLFVLSLNFKQMQLYHSLPFFFFLLGTCVQRKSPKLFTKLSLVVIVTFGVIWLPFGRSSIDVLRRLFPVGRGVFEDYVANFWCMFNVFKKIRSNSNMLGSCALATLLTALPANWKLFRNPTYDNFVLALVNTSFSFFLFSYQVHEKSILLVSLPVLLLGSCSPYLRSRIPSLFTLVFWFTFVSTFSLFYLLTLDKLTIAFYSLQTLYLVLFWLLDNNERNLGPFRLLFGISIAGTFVLSAASLIIPNPARFPFLFPLLISFYSFIHFFAFFLFFNYIQLFYLENKRKIKM